MFIGGKNWSVSKKASTEAQSEGKNSGSVDFLFLFSVSSVFSVISVLILLESGPASTSFESGRARICRWSGVSAGTIRCRACRRGSSMYNGGQAVDQLARASQIANARSRAACGIELSNQRVR
jgi:hypothetical protein